MTIYVDDYRMKWKGMVMSHMVSDTSTEELIEFAKKLRLKPQWIQKQGTWREHFDVSESKRQLAIKLGAVPLQFMELHKKIIAPKKENN